MTTPHILVVDDDPDTRVLVSMVLEDHGYSVSQVESAPAAWDYLQTHRPDLILLDVMMPGEDGFTFARRLRAHPPTADLPILMFTAKGLLDDKATGFQAGADDYLAKPVHPADLIARVRALLARRPARVAAPPRRPQSVITCLSVLRDGETTAAAWSLAAALAAAGDRVVVLGPQNGADAVTPLLSGSAALQPEGVQEVLRPLIEGGAVLPCPASTLRALSLDAPGLRRVLAALAPLADRVLVDPGDQLDACGEALLAASTHLVLLAEPTRASLALADRMLRALRQAGASAARVSALLVYSTPEPPALNVPVIQKGLGAEHVGLVPALSEPALHAPGAPPAEAYHRLALALRERAGAQ
ncbi:MAG TPA: response regulator [Aggregatilineales bacterium]|nr:response regulator [Aggregatilineales bacterium]